MPENTEYEYKFIDPEMHEQDIVPLFEEIFQEKITSEQFRWKYLKNPLGPMIVSSVWEKQTNNLVGILSAFKRYFIYKGEIIVAYHFGDGMVKKQCRGKGVYRPLVDALVDFIRKDNAFFWIGYPNDNAAPVYRKYENNRELYISNVYYYANGVKNILDVLMKNKNAARLFTVILNPLIQTFNFYFQKIKHDKVLLKPLDKFDDIIEIWSFESASGYNIFPLRNTKYLDWKTDNAPENIKKNVFKFWFEENDCRIGYCVLYNDSRRNILKILDILCANPEENNTKCFNAIVKYSVNNKYDAITTNLAGRKIIIADALRRSGFKKFKSIRSNIFILNKDMEDTLDMGDSLWFQAPIDRDDFYY